jgi:hypothetical protein
MSVDADHDEATLADAYQAMLARQQTRDWTAWDEAHKVGFRPREDLDAQIGKHRERLAYLMAKRPRNYRTEANKHTAAIVELEKERDRTGLPSRAWVDPPDPTGRKGRKAGGYTAIGITNTKMGDAVEQALADHFGMTNEHPEKRQGPLDVSIGKEGYEVKAVSTSATEYKAKPKKHEVAEKLAYAKKHGLDPRTMIVVYSPTERRIYVYSKPGIGAYRLTGPRQGWTFHGTIPLDLGDNPDPAAIREAVELLVRDWTLWDEEHPWIDKERPPGAMEFAGSRHTPVQFLADASERYNRTHHIEHPAPPRDYGRVMADPIRGRQIADLYAAMPTDDPEAHEAYRQLAKEVHQQYEFLTKELGVKVEVVDHDPYANAAEMVRDVTDNHHLAVLSTKSTGPHPFLSDRENDEFRAVHDAFGHAATGRGFDRNGEEAAWAKHSRMFSPLARRAMTTETRGQNSAMVWRLGHFPEQKVALLPEEFAIRLAKALGVAHADDDNFYEVGGIHHTSLGRWPRATRVEPSVLHLRLDADVDTEPNNWLKWDEAHRVLQGHHFVDRDMPHNSREWGERTIAGAIEDFKNADPNGSGPWSSQKWRDERGMKQVSKWDQRLVAAAKGNTRIRNNLIKEQTARAQLKGFDDVRPEVRAAMEGALDNFERDPRIEHIAHALGIHVRFEAAVDTTREKGDTVVDPFPAKASAEQYVFRGAHTIHLHDAGNALNLLEPEHARPIDPEHLRSDYGANAPGSSMATSGWQGTITHEFGHVVEDTLARRQNDPRIAEWRKLWQQYKDAYDKGFSDAGGDFNGRGETMANAVSYYSTWNEKEGFAEVFSAIMAPGYNRADWPPRARPLLDFMERLVSST